MGLEAANIESAKVRNMVVGMQIQPKSGASHSSPSVPREEQPTVSQLPPVGTATLGAFLHCASSHCNNHKITPEQKKDPEPQPRSLARRVNWLVVQ
ncbi:hypothetical protein CAOG_009706, partial [Capsaspora owczarzaki ATCC 30864]